MGDAVELDIKIDETPAIMAAEDEALTAPAEAPPATEPEPQNPETEEDKQKKALAKLAFEKRVADREAKQLREELEKLRANLPQQSRPVVPELPDPLTMTDDQHRKFMEQRDAALAQRAAWDAQQQMLNEQKQRAEQERQRQQQEAVLKAAETYTARAVQLGVKPDELHQAGNMVAQYGIDANLAEMILQDEQGPLITKYLSQNIMELAELNNLPVTQAAVRIATIIKQKAAALKPKVSTAPAPPQPVRSGGIGHKDYGIEGATYE